MTGDTELTGLSVYICDAYRTNWVFVRIETTSGVYGWGEATLEYREHAVAEAVLALEPGLRDRNLADIESWWQEAYRDAYWRGGPVLMSALSAVEMALWDIKGKLLGVPVHQLLGGAVRQKIACYANGWFSGAETPDEFAAAAVTATSWGYRALKWDPFGSAFRTIGRSALQSAVEHVRAVRNAVDEDVELIVEAHGRFDDLAARNICHALENEGVAWIEEPLIPGNLANYAALRKSTRLPISGGERLYSRWDYREVFQLGALDILQPDVSHAGGISELRRIAATAEMWQLAFCPHNPSGPVANAATMQLAAATPNFLYLETMATDVPWRSEIATETVRFEGGFMYISDAPGLGVEIDVDALSAHPYQPHPLRHYNGSLTSIRPPEATTTFGSTDAD